MSTAEYTRRLLIALALAAVLVAAWRVAGIVLPGLGGVVLAVVIRVAATAIAPRLPIPTRRVSALVVLVLLAPAVALATLRGGEFVGRIDALRDSLPDVAVRLRKSLEQSAPGRALLSMPGGAASARLWAQAAVSGVGLLFSAVTELLIVVFIALYLSFDPRSCVWRRWARRTKPRWSTMLAGRGQGVCQASATAAHGAIERGTAPAFRPSRSTGPLVGR